MSKQSKAEKFVRKFRGYKEDQVIHPMSTGKILIDCSEAYAKDLEEANSQLLEALKGINGVIEFLDETGHVLPYHSQVAISEMKAAIKKAKGE